jgi:hypothetical protein
MRGGGPNWGAPIFAGVGELHARVQRNHRNGAQQHTINVRKVLRAVREPVVRGVGT